MYRVNRIVSLLFMGVVITAAGYAYAKTTPGKDAKLIAASITFHTLDHAKAEAAPVRIILSRGGGEVAELEGLTDRFQSNTLNGPFALKITTPITGDELTGLISTISFAPKKAQTWNFSYQIKLSFSDGTNVVRDVQPITLTRDIHTRVASLNPAA